MKKAKKKLKQQQNTAELTSNEREQIIEAIKSLNKLEIFDLLTDDDKPITNDMLEEMMTTELTDILEMQIEELGKWV